MTGIRTRKNEKKDNWWPGGTDGLYYKLNLTGEIGWSSFRSKLPNLPFQKTLLYRPHRYHDKIPLIVFITPAVEPLWTQINFVLHWIGFRLPHPMLFYDTENMT